MNVRVVNSESGKYNWFIAVVLVASSFWFFMRFANWMFDNGKCAGINLMLKTPPFIPPVVSPICEECKNSELHIDERESEPAQNSKPPEKPHLSK